MEEFPETRRPAYKLWIDLGPDLGVRKSSAQVTERYTPAELVGRQVVAVVNLPRKQVGPLMSEVLVTGLPDADGAIVLAQPERPVPDGARLARRRAEPRAQERAGRGGGFREPRARAAR